MIRFKLSMLSAAALALAASSALAEEAPVPAPADWGRALAEDARAFHDIIADSHPGHVDKENPGFNPLLERGLATALERAKTADSYEDWYFALQEYAASFDDGHLALTRYAPMGHAWTADWPGFLTGLRDNRHVVVFNRDPAAPPIGATLVSCDGRPADAFAADQVGRAAGRWKLQSRRAAYAATLFVDQHNPYAPRPEACVFEINGKARTYELAWRDLPDAVRDEGFAAGSSPRYFAPIELRGFGKDSYWIGLGSFESDPTKPKGQQLTALQAKVAEQAEALREADIVVFDLRGNSGGSSSWSYQLAATLWGDAWVARAEPRSSGVDWRVSKGNLAEVVAFKPQVAGNAEMTRWVEVIEAGIGQAMRAGEPLWRQAGDGAGPKEATTTMTARVYVVTDYGCASACLDAMDTLKALGAIHVGLETSADTLYMEVRREELPSRRVSAVIPMKVYRGRARGNNETYVPDHLWAGRLDDTAGLEALIAKIDAAR